MQLYGIEFTPAPFESVVQFVIDGQAGLVVTANLDHLATLRRSAPFRDAYRSADTRTIDGFPLILLSRIAGQTNIERIPGSDLAKAVFNKLNPQIHRPMFIASDEGTKQATISALTARGFSHDDLLVVIPPFRFENSTGLSNELRSKISSFKPTQVFFGVGAPKSEIWCSTNRDCFGNAAILCVGSGLNMTVGTLKRSPHWMRASGLEWAWRFMQNPTRLGPRYVKNAMLLPWLVYLAIKQRKDSDSVQYLKYGNDV